MVARTTKVASSAVIPMNETDFAGPEHLDRTYVAGYDRKAGFDPSVDVAALRGYGLGPNSTLVDLGAGTGAFAVEAAAFCRRVVAVDVSPAMIEAARERVAAAGVSNVECVEAGFLTYEHRDPAPDFVYTRHALHHLPDLWKGIALARIAAMLAPTGVLQVRDLVFSFAPADARAGFEQWVQAGADRPEDGWTWSELETHLAEEHSTYTWLFEPLLERAGFELLVAEYGAMGAYANYICAKRGSV
jgi:ubiquinone/menaquinone biosynthesis C-methylase UbiE